jgi:hypothetical protein
MKFFRTIVLSILAARAAPEPLVVNAEEYDTYSFCSGGCGEVCGDYLWWSAKCSRTVFWDCVGDDSNICQCTVCYEPRATYFSCDPSC